jgi:competence protein ComEC
MRRSILSYGFLLSFLCTVLVLQWATEATRSPFLWIGIAASACIALPYRNKRAFLLAPLLGIAVACASVNRATRPPAPSDAVTYAAKQPVTLVGIVTDEPDRREKMTTYEVRALRLRTATGAPVPVTGTVLVRDTKRTERLNYGDRVVTRGTLRTPWTMKEYRMDRALDLRGIHSVLTGVQSVQFVDGNRGFAPLKLLYALKERFEAQIERLFPEPHAAFLEGLLTGSRRGIPKNLTDDFNAVGLTHIIAISGTNITIILAAVGGLLFWLPLRWRFVPSLLTLVAFTLLTGASASVVRAAIMGALGLVALQSGRLADTRLLILWAAFLMLAWNPAQLWWDASFQLSFLAVSGLGECAPLVQPVVRRFPERFGIRESLQATLSAQLATDPWILYLFGRFSLIAPLANLLVAPLVPFAMLFGFLSVTASFLWFPAGQLLSYAAWGVLQAMLSIIHALASVPLASISVGKVHPMAVAGMYGILTAIVLTTHRPKSSPPSAEAGCALRGSASCSGDGTREK